MSFDLDHALRYLIASEGSDLHLKIPSPPLVRLHGELQPIPGTEPLAPQDTMDAVQEMLHDANKLAEFEAENEVDFSYSLEGLARFRVNAFYQRGTVSVVMRAIPVNIKSVDELDAARRRSHGWPRRSAGSSCSPARPAPASRPRSRR